MPGLIVFLTTVVCPERIVGELTTEEIANAETRIIQKTQRESFEDEYQALSRGKELPKHSKLLALKPKLDEEGLIRSDGRLVNAEYLPYDMTLDFQSSYQGRNGLQS